MRSEARQLGVSGWLATHVVDAAFALAVVGWLVYVRRLTRDLYFWSDDLTLIERAGSWRHFLKPYNGALSLVSLVVYRAGAELGHLSFTPFMIAGTASLVAVPVSYFVTTRHQFGPPLAAILATPLLWFNGMTFRPAGLNHFLALVGGIVCAAALNRGRRADGVIAVALAFSLCSAGGGLVVAGACVVHNVLVRAPLRRWLSVLVPSALYGLWWVLAKPATKVADPLGVWQTVRVVRDLFLAPFYQVAFGFWPLAVVLVVAFFLWGAMQLRHGLASGANFVAWTAAMVAWALALVQSRGSLADPGVFRYAYLSLGFALLAVVPRRPISWPDRLSVTNRRWLAVAAVIVLVFAGVRILDARIGLEAVSAKDTELGRKAKGTMLAVHLGPSVIPDDTPITFFGWGNPHGTARRARDLMHRYGSPFDAGTIATIDHDLVDLRTVQAHFGGSLPKPACSPLTQPLELAPTSYRENELGPPAPRFPKSPPGPREYRFWSTRPLTISVRRFGTRWARLSRVPAGRYTSVRLPVLSSDKPWEIRADGACLVQ